MSLADQRLLAALNALNVQTDWQPLHRLHAALRVVDDGDEPGVVAVDTHHRTATIEAWASAYRAEGRAAFFPLYSGPGRPRGATLEGMLSGRLIEEAWVREALGNLGTELKLHDAREQDPDPGWDFEISSTAGASGGFTVDVKLHSEPFRQAAEYTGLEPDDCVPLGIYKMLVARERQQKGGAHHVYAFMFRPRLAQDLMRALITLPPDMREALELLFATTAPSKKRPQRRAVAAVVDKHLMALLPLLEGSEFRLISTHRAVNLFLEKVETRAPMLRGQGQSFGSTINMHYSWSREMTPLATVLRGATRNLDGLLQDFQMGRM